MNFTKTIVISFLGALIISCNGHNGTKKNNFTLKTAGDQKEFKLNQPVKIELQNKNKIKIESVSYSIGGDKVEVVNNELKLTNVKLGHQDLVATISYDGTTEKAVTEITVLSDKAPKLYTYEIINEYPHDMKAYTQGLEFYKDTLYESTGRNGQSSLRKLNYRTGEIYKKIELNKAYFGEGITILNDKIYMLTWRSKTGFVYDVNTFEQIDSFKYNNSREGWGLTNDGKKLYKSDGTERIWTLDPDTLMEENYIQTVTNTAIFNKANELEYVDGKIYANTYLKDGVMIIDHGSGAILGVVDFRGLKERVKQHPDLDVLNGIAYNPSTKTFFVTGKNWDKLFEVRILEKQ